MTSRNIRQRKQREEAPLQVLSLESLEARVYLSTFVVNDAGDDGSVAGTLRWAIEEANANAGQDTIEFGLSGIIAPESALPVITDPVVIDATTAPGYAGVPLVTIDGVDAEGAAGLEVLAPNSEIHGLAIIRFAEGIILSGDDNEVSRNYVGISPTGEADLGNKSDGVVINDATRNRITQNVISGNLGHGLLIDGGRLNTVKGNRIGTDAAGLNPVGNKRDGIRIHNSRNNRIGGDVDCYGLHRLQDAVSGDDVEGVGAQLIRLRRDFQSHIASQATRWQRDITSNRIPNRVQVCISCGQGDIQKTARYDVEGTHQFEFGCLIREPYQKLRYDLESFTLGVGKLNFDASCFGARCQPARADGGSHVQIGHAVARHTCCIDQADTGRQTGKHRDDISTLRRRAVDQVKIGNVSFAGVKAHVIDDGLNICLLT